VYDALHRTVVSGLIAFTVVSSGWLSYKALNYFLYKRPVMTEVHRKAMQDKIAEEQATKELELMKESKNEVLR